MTFLEYVFVKRKSDHTDHLTVTKMKLVQLRQNRKTTLNNNTSRKPAAGCERTAGKSDCLFRCSSSRYTSVSNYFAMVKFGKICICTKWWTAGWTNFLFLKFQHSRERVCCIQKNAGQMNQGEGFLGRKLGLPHEAARALSFGANFFSFLKHHFDLVDCSAFWNLEFISSTQW